MSAGDVPLKVLFAIAGLPAGGAERQLALLISGLDRRMIEPGLLIFNSADKIHYGDMLRHVGHLRALGLSGNSAGRLILPLLTGFRSAVEEFSPDVVFTSLNIANHVSRLSKLIHRWRAPLITSVRNVYRDSYSARDKLAERALWRLSSAIICNSMRARSELIADLKVPPARIHYVANGIDPSFFDPVDPGLPDWPEGRIALTIGRFAVQKNHLGLLDAIVRLDRRGLLDDWRFVWVGEGPLEREIRSAISRANLAHRIVLRAPSRDPRPFYAASELIVVPSLYEGTSNVALEAQAAARPVAISVSANDGSVVSDRDGFVLSSDMADELARILVLPAATLAARGRSARERVASDYGVSRMVEQTQDIVLRAGGYACTERVS